MGERLFPFIIGVAAVAGLWVGVNALDGNTYEVLNHIAVPSRPRWWIPLAVLGGHMGFWALLVMKGELRGPDFRQLWPLSTLLLFLLPLPATVATWALYAAVAMIALSAYLLVGKWRGPTFELSHRQGWLIVGIAMALFVGWTALFQELMHQRLLLGYPDIGWYYKRLLNTVRHGAFLKIYAEQPTFWDHLCPGIAILLPAFLLFQKVSFLIIAQCAFVGGTALLLYHIARQRELGVTSSVGICLLYLLHPASSQLTFNYSYGFHPPTLALPFIVASVHFLEQKRCVAGVVCAILAVSMQEHIAMFYVGIGAMWLLRRQWRLGLSTVLIGGAYFVFVFSFFMPWHTGGQNVHVSLWGELGDGIFDIALSPILRPRLFLAAVFNHHNLHMLLQLFLPMAAMALLAPRFLIAVAPAVISNMLRPDMQSKSIAFQYQTCTLGLLFLAAIVGLQSARERGNTQWARPLLVAALAAAMVSSIFLGLFPWAKSNIGLIHGNARIQHLPHAIAEVHALVPPTATVTGDSRTMMLFLDHRLVTHYDSKHTPRLDTDYHVYQVGAFNHPASTTYRQVNQLVRDGAYVVIYDQGGLIVLKRRVPLLPLAPTVF